MLKQEYSFPMDALPKPAISSGIFLDIETTGFHRDSTILYLAGCGYVEENHLHVIQWFNDDAVSEPEILLSLTQFLYKKFNVIYTYNGESFDIPYINHHCSFHGIPVFLNRLESFDFYKRLRPFQKAYGLKKGAQKDWESLLGINREDRYSGKELISIYKKYVRTRDEELLRLLLLHNLEDIRGMVHLSLLADCLSLADGNFIFLEMSYSPDFPSADNLSFLCRLSRPLPKELKLISSFDEYPSLKAVMETEGQRLSITLPVFDGIRKYFYSNFQDYYYLPKEDRAIHKSIGQYVDKSHRRRASAKNCYLKKEGLFLPLLPDKSRLDLATDRQAYIKSLPVYKENFGDSLSFLDVESLLADEQHYLLPFLTDWIKHILMAL